MGSALVLVLHDAADELIILLQELKEQREDEEDGGEGRFRSHLAPTP